MSNIDFSAYFYYDETSPSGLRWKVDTWSGWGNRKAEKRAGDPAGGRRKDGYWLLPRKYGIIYTHRAIVWLHGFDIKGLVIDHRDGDPSNNKFDNLRIGTQKTNAQNTRMRDSNTTGVVGVTWHRSRLNQDGSSTTYATCAWKEHGVQRYRRFPTHKHGLLPAFALAVKQREIEIAKLNAEGASYTDRHGKCLPA